MDAGTPANGIPASYRNPVIHDCRPSSYPGAWQVTDAALAAYGTAREWFGTSEVVRADGSSFRVKDYQYRLPDGSVGMELVPVSDSGPMRRADGGEVEGAALIDALLRQRMGLSADDQIFALIYYIHPELNRGTIAQFAAGDKIELGITHMGSYVGGGRTSNSPPLYHNRKWAVVGEPGNAFGYPANVAILSLEGVDQATLNTNLYLADCVLNNGVRFPTDYKNSQFRMAELNTMFMFYRDWVLEADYLRKETSWFTYCAAHKALVANIGLNLPHNLDAFKDVYGPTGGAEFFKQFSEFHFQVFGTEFTADLQTTFEPLWHKNGLGPDRIRAFSYPEYQAWNTARLNGKLDAFDGFKPLDPDAGTVWPPQSTADLVSDFAHVYASFLDAGAIAFCATLFAFGGEVVERMRVSPLDYLLASLPIAQQAMVAHARVHAAELGTAVDFADSGYARMTFAGLFAAFGGKPEDADDAFADAGTALEQAGLLRIAQHIARSEIQPETLAWAALEAVRDRWSAIVAAGAVDEETAYCDFMRMTGRSVAAERSVVVSNPLGIEHNMQPCIAHLVAIGMLPGNPQISLTPVATVMDSRELEPKLA